MWAFLFGFPYADFWEVLWGTFYKIYTEKEWICWVVGFAILEFIRLLPRGVICIPTCNLNSSCLSTPRQHLVLSSFKFLPVWWILKLCFLILVKLNLFEILIVYSGFQNRNEIFIVYSGFQNRKGCCLFFPNRLNSWIASVRESILVLLFTSVEMLLKF